MGRRRLDGSLPDRFGDVRLGDLMADPVAAIEGAYDGIGRETAPPHRDAVVSYLRDKPRAKHGAHHYMAEDWGFDPDTLHAELAEYMAQFEVVVEP